MPSWGSLSGQELVLWAAAKIQQARELFAQGLQVDSFHGPLYHAYGNMELVSYSTAQSIFTSSCCCSVKAISVEPGISYSGGSSATAVT